MRTRTGYKQKTKKQLTESEREAIRQWKALEDITPTEWVARVKSLPEQAQGPTARVIWWNFWSNRTVAERWDEFDAWLKFDPREETDPVPINLLKECLRAVGYPEYRVRLILETKR
jgi:hypothetical protein